MKPSEWLQSEGWKRMHPGRMANLSDWRDPVTGKDYLFIEAIQIQDARENAAEQSVQRTAIQPAPIKDFVDTLKKYVDSDDD